MEKKEILSIVKERATSWLNSPIDEDTREEIRKKDLQKWVIPTLLLCY